MKLFTTLLLLVPTLLASAAGVKISDLALSTAPSTNTFLEIADLNATGTNKSAKVLYTNLFMRAGLWTNAASVVSLNNLTANGTLKLTADDGAGQGVIDLWTAGTKRWTLSGGGILYPQSNYDLGTTVNPVQAGYFSSLGVQLADRKITSGTGSPEGVRTAEVSSLYLQTDGAAGTTLWTKTTGSGNTGWRALSVGGTAGTVIASGTPAVGDVFTSLDGTTTNGVWSASINATEDRSVVKSFTANSATNRALVVDTSSEWTHDSAYPFSVKNNGVQSFGVGALGGGIVVGPNSIALEGHPEPWDAFYSTHCVSLGDDPRNNFFIESTTNEDLDQFTIAVLRTDVQESLQGNHPPYSALILAAFSPTNGYFTRVRASAGTNSYQTGLAVSDWSDVDYAQLYPLAADGDTPLWIKTEVAHTTGLLFALTNNTTRAFSVDFAGLVSGSGIASSATDTPVAISSTGWTNSFGKNATAWLQGTAVTYVVYNNAGTSVRTNILAAGTTVPIPLQSGGKFIITAGSGIDGSAVPW